MERVVVVGAVRTPVGRFGGYFKETSAEYLMTTVIKELLTRIGLTEKDYPRVDDVLVGNVANSRGNIARYCLLDAGLPVEIPGVTIDRQCASGLEALNMAFDKIRSGAAEFILAGGVENMTICPYQLEVPRMAYQRTPPAFVQTKFSPDSVGDPPMGITAENIAEKYGISREQQDEYSLQSHQRAVAATREGRFDEELVAIKTTDRKGREIVYEYDEHPRPDTSLEKLAKLSPAFKPGGSVTAGNSSGMNDGAACLAVVSEKAAAELGLEPLAVITDYANVGVDPNYMGIGPIFAVRKLLKRTGLSLDDIDLFEINEAFAAQIIHVINELGLDTAKLNVNGGAVALGHPLGCSGAKIATTLVFEMRRRKIDKGVAALCVGGGQGSAMLFESP